MNGNQTGSEEEKDIQGIPPMSPPTSPNQDGPAPIPQPQEQQEPERPASTPQAPLPPPPPSLSGRPGEPTPPSPMEDVGIRTMASDLSSLKESGGTEVKPQTFNPEEFNEEPEADPSKMELPQEPQTPVVESGKNKKLIVALSAVIFIVIAAAIVYFFIVPLLKPVVEPPISLPPIEEQQPLAEEVLPPITHQSFFIASPAIVMPIGLVNLSAGEINSSIELISGALQIETINEVIFSLSSGELLKSKDLLNLFLPEMEEEFLVNNFNEDFTAFAYKDANGTWSGYVFRADSETAVGAIKSNIKVIIESADTNSFYSNKVGEPNTAGFKDGLNVNGESARYLSYSTPGASFNYGWYNNYLVISTSFNGFKEALKLLGFSS